MFKSDFKYYKSKKPPPNLHHVINFKSTTGFPSQNVKRVDLRERKRTLLGLKPSETWNVYEIISNPGLIFIENPFTSLGQRYWCVRSLMHYSRKPNKTNLDAHKLIPDMENWWEFCHFKGYKSLSEKLRWATLGYHHNWDTKVYSEESKDEFPTDLSSLCKYISDLIGYDKFTAEAAIVNYYHLDSTLSGHTDHSEQNLQAPLFSFSFGQTAIFLLGGETVDEKPTAIFLHSGDVVVMSKESRLAYHGVPKIIKSDEEPWQQEMYNVEDIEEGFDEEVVRNCTDEAFWKPFRDYITCSRINVNVRQVLAEGAVKFHS